MEGQKFEYSKEDLLLSLFERVFLFIDMNRGLTGEELTELALREIEKGNTLIEGILKIEKGKRKDGEAIYLVTLKESLFPPDKRGGAIDRLNIAFVAHNDSPEVLELYKKHEISHLNQLWARESSLHPAILNKIREAHAIILDILRGPITAIRGHLY